MRADEPRKVFVVKLRPLPHVKDLIRALRFALEVLLRRFGLRCTSISEEKTDW
jgi:hypothetical protein